MDIACIQEHWLYRCQADTINTMIPDYRSYVRCTDDDNPIKPWCMPRGMGGVGILWREDLQKYIRPVKNYGNERIVAVTLQQEDLKICVINAYMPSGNNRKTKEKYMDTLAAIRTVVTKFNESHYVILVGDFNMDLFKPSYEKDTRRIKLLELTQDLNLKLISDGQKSTMFAHNGRHESHIDLIFCSGAKSHNITYSKVEVAEKLPHNTSCHVPISIELECGIPRTAAKTTKNKEVRLITKWHTLNKEIYNNCITAYLQLINIELLDPSSAMEIMTLIIKASTLQSTEVRISRGNSKRKTTWPPDIVQALRRSRQVHALWKEAGRPGREHPTSKARHRASRAVRAAQRKHTAHKREAKYQKIMDAQINDQRLFYSLVREHMATPLGSKAIMDGNDLITDPEEAAEAWAGYYTKLATPAENPRWNQEFLEQAVTETDKLKLEVRDCPAEPIKTQEITQALKRLNKGKAADLEGIRAEHLQAAAGSLTASMTWLFTEIFQTGRAPQAMKTGKKIPIPKKGKDNLLMPNHRGITVTSIIGKTYEHVIKNKLGPLHQDGLQFGFSEGLSPQMAAVSLTEIIAQAKDQKTDLYVVTLDAEKAFDVVNHPIMLQTLHNKNIKPALWRTIQDLYDGMRERVTWQGALSSEFEIRQGVGQGRILSPLLYKAYMDQPLAALRRTGQGIYIGSTYMGSPACADDVLLASTTSDGARTLLNIAETESCDRRYNIQPLKSAVASKSGEEPIMNLGDINLPYESNITHLGITRDMRSLTSLVENRIGLGRNTVYSLMPAGMHGENGLSPVALHKLIQSYVLPRMLHGLDSVILQQKEVQKLDIKFTGIIRNLLSLRERVAREAVYLLSGFIPVEAEIHIRVLVLYGAITRLPSNSPLFEVAFRQIAHRDSPSSWFKYVRKVAAKYGLEPVVLGAMSIPWQAKRWKRYITDKIRKHWDQEIRVGAGRKSSLRWLDTRLCRPGKPHHIWPRGGCSARSRMAASYRAKMISGSYILQSNRAKFNQFQVDTTCPLCQGAVEDLPHFLVACPRLQETRERHMKKMTDLLTECGAPVPRGNEEWCFYILNCGAVHIGDTCDILRKSGRDAMFLNPRSSMFLTPKSSCRCIGAGAIANIMCAELHKAHCNFLLQKAAPTGRKNHH